MPTIRTDVVDVYVARRAALGLEFLQLRRVKRPLHATWQPVMGHVEPGETAVQAALREVLEETGLDVRSAASAMRDAASPSSSGAAVGMWALEQVHPFFLAELDAIMLSPRFVIEVTNTWKPTLNHEHDAARWVQEAKIDDMFLWPGQRAALREAAQLLRGSSAEPLLRVSTSA